MFKYSIFGKILLKYSTSILLHDYHFTCIEPHKVKNVKKQRRPRGKSKFPKKVGNRIKNLCCGWMLSPVKHIIFCQENTNYECEAGEGEGGAEAKEWRRKCDQHLFLLMLPSICSFPAFHRNCVLKCPDM